VTVGLNPTNMNVGNQKLLFDFNVEVRQLKLGLSEPGLQQVKHWPKKFYLDFICKMILFSGTFQVSRQHFETGNTYQI
jgi:hypothetical protein